MKTDSKLGHAVCEHLTRLGVETPFVDGGLEAPQRLEKIKYHFEEIMREGLRLDLTDDSLSDSPLRVAKMYVNELFSGLDYNNFPKCTTTNNKMNYRTPVVSERIVVMTTCEHHFATIEGTCQIKYIPNERVIGLSKFNRIVDFFSRRPQIQERLTLQIYHTLVYILGTEDVSVEIVATHNCIKTRGVQQHGGSTTTSENSGVFESSQKSKKPKTIVGYKQD